MKKRPTVILVLALVVALDQFTKHLASTRIDPMQPIDILPVFSLVNLRNVGAAFGLFSSIGNTVFIAVTVLAIALIVFIIVKEKEGFIPFSLILAGAVGNLTDRLSLGYVRDFLDFHIGTHHWPAFNVADSSLTIGMILLIIGAFMPADKKDNPQ